MNWKKDGEVYCIDEGFYSEHITKRNSYIIHSIGEGTKEGKIRIKSNRGKLVWIADFHFVDYQIPSIASIQLDDEIKDPKNDYIEVTITFSDHKKRWVIFTTPQHLNGRFNEHREYIIGDYFILLKEINEFIIHKTIHQLDLKNQLIKISQVLS